MTTTSTRGRDSRGAEAASMDPADMMSVAEVAALFGVTQHSVYWWARTGKLAGYKQDGRRPVMFRASEVTALYQQAAS